MELITLHTKRTTYQIGISKQGIVHHIYYGPKAKGDMSGFLTFRDRGFSGNPYESRADRTYSLDAMPMEYPCYGCGDFRSPAFNIRNKDGVFGTDLRYKSHRIVPGKYNIPGLPAVYADIQDGEDEAPYTLELFLEDNISGIKLVLRYGVLPDLDVITRNVTVENSGNQTVYLNKICSTALDFVCGEYDLIHFYGRHAMERNMERSPLIHGNQSIGSFRGTSSHQHNPFVILAQKDTTEDYGNCYGISLLYSGNFKCEALKDQFDQTRLLMGLSDEMFDYELKPGDIFYAPEAAMAYTSGGFSDLTHIFHQLIRYHVCRGKFKEARRPVLLNNWEATYFNFNGDKIIDIARQASQLGVEMLVLDDGWFGHRNDDNSSLGDWYVNENKLGRSLAEVSEQIHSMGMKFGLWIEPEMVSEDSDLYREHPDWAYIIPGRKPVMARNQLVLDFSRKEVVDYIFGQITRVLDCVSIEYIKMDMNRSICDVYTAVCGRQNFGQILHQYVLGVYDFLERLICRYPDLIIEGCSGGGGRYDAGMLYYTPQIWCSDNTDAIDRIKIQHGTSFGYPICTVGSHVSAVPNHQTGRITPLHTRTVVAMAGSFGYELDLNTLSDKEKQQVKKDIADYKRFWPLIHNGDYYRLHDPRYDHAAAAWIFVSGDRTEALLNVVALDAHGNAPSVYIKLKGLDPDITYRVEVTSGCSFETGRWGDCFNGVFSGSALMYTGLWLPERLGEYESIQYYISQAQ